MTKHGAARKGSKNTRLRFWRLSRIVFQLQSGATAHGRQRKRRQALLWARNSGKAFGTGEVEDHGKRSYNSSCSQLLTTKEKRNPA